MHDIDKYIYISNSCYMIFYKHLYKDHLLWDQSRIYYYHNFSSELFYTKVVCLHTLEVLLSSSHGYLKEMNNLKTRSRAKIKRAPK